MGFLFVENMTDIQTPTLQELVKLALPIETRVLVEHGSLDHPVTWVVSTPARDLTRLDTGDFAFLLPPYPNDLARQFSRLAQIGVAGIALVVEPSPALVEAAQQAQLPLVVLPASANLRQIERLALAFVLDRDAAMEQRATQLYQHLTLLSAENAGLEAMASLIGRTTGKSVVIQDKRLNIIAAWIAPEDASARTIVEEWITALGNVPEELRDRKRAAQNRQIVEQSFDPSASSGQAFAQDVPLTKKNRTRLIVPIVAKGMARGYLSLIAGRDALEQFDRSMAEQGAAACALEMAKAKAVSEAEKRVRGGFVEGLLAGSLSPDEAVRWAKRDKYNPDGKHAVVVADWAKKEHPSYRRLETIIHGLTRADILVHAREDEIVVFVRLDPRQGIESARVIAENIRRQASAEYTDDPLTIGIGRAVDALIDLRDSYREARQAMSMARRLADPNPLYFGELNVYRLLFLLEHHPELDAFRQETIGTLVEYDRTQGTDLIETLTSYFAHKGNLSQTAEALFVHRNTLLYRMERIREISGLDLDNPETRLSIELALRAHRLLLAREDR
ncbi:MAG: helix-turn-helix domain-containing protein [Chloroflexota bacterium]